VTFTATVSGGANPTGSVSFTSDGGAVANCTGVALSAGSAQCPTSALTQGAHAIVASYSGDAGNAASQNSPALSQVVNAGGGGGGGGSINAALAANGGVASAQSTASGYSVAAVNNGDRAGLSIWSEANKTGFPVWVEVDFNGAQTIDHVILYSVQDNLFTPVDPSDTLTFTQYGITAFDVQVWNGASWATVGSVSGNTLVKRSVSFAPTNTSKIRVMINAAATSRAMVTEIEAWTH
jgi:hypothetical protein